MVGGVLPVSESTNNRWLETLRAEFESADPHERVCLQIAIDMVNVRLFDMLCAVGSILTRNVQFSGRNAGSYGGSSYVEWDAYHSDIRKVSPRSFH